MLTPKETTITTHSSQETCEFARGLSTQLVAGDLITLEGELGAGKTTFVQGLAAGLGVAEDANSPTFVLIVEHQGRLPLLHLDAYRLENRGGEPICYDAIRDAGILDLIDRDDAVKVVEWPERVADFLPYPRFAIQIEPGEKSHDRLLKIAEYSTNSEATSS